MTDRRGRNLTLAAALLGWMFDGMEMGLFPLVANDALRELLGDGADDARVKAWFGVIQAGFLVGAATGGVLFGWLGDKLGRVKAMTISVLVYSGCSALGAAAQTPEQLAVLRFVGALGMGGEWALGVALVMEVWPNASRVWLAGWIGAFGNLGYTVCGTIALGLIQVGKELPGYLTGVGVPAGWAASLTANGNWRLLMLSGAGPALLTLLIRLFVPESEKWAKGKAAAANWSSRDLLGVLVGAAAAGGVIALFVPDLQVPWQGQLLGSVVGGVVVLGGYLYPAWAYLSRAGLGDGVRRHTLGRMLLAAGLSSVPLVATWGAVMWMYPWVTKELPGGNIPEARPWMQIASSVGAALGCLAGAWLSGRYGRRAVYAGLCLTSAAVIVGFFRWNTAYGPVVVLSAGLVGFVTASFYGWLPLYLPELFPTAVRATGQGFGFNCGRVAAAAINLQMPAFIALCGGSYATACAAVAGVYAVGLILITIAPETRGKPLPE